MVTSTNEKALEQLIELKLTGSCKEERTIGVKEPNPAYALNHFGYISGESSSFNKEFCIDEKIFWQFLEATQPQELNKLNDRPNWQRIILERLNRKIKSDGIISLLKKGLLIDDAHLTFLYRLPYNTLNPEVKENFAKNIFSVTRQVHYSESEPLKSVDMVLFLNGISIITFELKNLWTGQSVYNAIKQYKEQRSPSDPLFNFGRCIVHFAMDTEDIFMATKLDGNETFFLPFNKGFNFGKGNPLNPSSYKTAYLTDEILVKENLVNIIEHFAKIVEEKGVKTKKVKKNLYFPRYHQLRVVNRLLAEVKEKGVGGKYLIQHSAGSGKSYSITWLAFQLVELYNQSGTLNLFDSVIVITDRKVLDKQLRDDIKLFSEVKNIVAHAENSADLKKYLELGKKIIISTVQKFPFIVDGIQDLSNRNFAVIIDEAHSSQSGLSSHKLNVALNSSEDDVELEDIEDFILKTMDERKMSKNASFFAFTATPKPATLEKFGEPYFEAGQKKFKPFDLYSMKQAIEEGFILDVLANYTTYKSYYQVLKSTEGNPLFETVKAQKKLKTYVEGHKETIEVKARIMLDHFIENVVNSRKLKGKAKGMVVTMNIDRAIKYYYALRRAIQDAHAPFDIIIAFSGKKKVDGVELTEERLNGFPSKDIPDKLREDKYRLLVVANKYLYGFDEPLLNTMYVDKKLQGVMAVQALSRLNRSNQKMDKKDTFVLDFFNTTDDIKEAFDPFYTSTSLSQPTDINVLHDLKNKMDETGIYEWSEVELFNEKYFNNVSREELDGLIDINANRFNNELELEEEVKIDFKIKAKHFVKIYGQIASIMPQNIIQWEMLYWFLKLLIPKLKISDPDKDKIDELLNNVDLNSYGIARVKLNYRIDLDPAATEVDPINSNPRGYHGSEVIIDPLNEIIKAFNEKHFDSWGVTDDERKVKFINIARSVYNHPNFKEQVVNNPDELARRIALEKLIIKAVNKERKNELDLYKLFASDEDFKKAFNATIARMLLQSQKDSQLFQQLFKEMS
ncbi:MAG: DEAD/DEAH box helicase family protein [Ignavibacteriales bacterium]|nr:DEAD/DEAH box helicase family protein [Ignavibacteriales bacterium]